MHQVVETENDREALYLRQLDWWAASQLQIRVLPRLAVVISEEFPSVLEVLYATYPRSCA